jgi:hypothetical protein
MEIWKDITGYEGKYQISNIGKVKSLSNSRSGGKNKYYDYKRKEKILSLKISKRGYSFIALSDSGTSSVFYIHHLVAGHFIGERNGRQINHRNGIKTDNRVENLEWCSPKQNIIHARDILKHPYGHKKSIVPLP